MEDNLADYGAQAKVVDPIVHNLVDYGAQAKIVHPIVHHHLAGRKSGGSNNTSKIVGCVQMAAKVCSSDQFFSHGQKIQCLFANLVQFS